MLNSAVIDTMLERLGKRRAPALRASCLSELNLAIRELERGAVKPWFLQELATGTLTANVDYLDQPLNFLIETEDGTFEVQHPDEGWKELTKVPFDKIRKETANEDAAFPEGYALWGSKFYFGPKPLLGYNYRFDYYKRTTAIADNNVECTNSWVNEFFDYTTSKALIVLARDHIQNDRMAGNMKDAFIRAENLFLKEVTAREVANETLLLTDEEN